MKTTFLTSIIMFCLLINSQSQSIIPLSGKTSFYSSVEGISIEQVSDTMINKMDGNLIKLVKYKLNGSDNYGYFKFTEETNTSVTTVYTIESVQKLKEPPYKKKRDTDTLFVVLDQDYGWSLTVYIDMEINYSGIAVPIWISPTLGYRVMEHGNVNIASMMELGSRTNLVFKENIEFNGQDTVFLSADQANNLISFEPVDENGTLLENLNMGGQYLNQYSFVFDLANGGVASSNITFNNYDSLYTSDYHGQIYMCFGSQYRDNTKGHSNYFIEYPIQDSITFPITLANEPDSLASAVLNYSQLNNCNFITVGLGSFKKFRSPFTGKPVIWGSIGYSQPIHGYYWETTLFMDMQESNKFGYCTQQRIKCEEVKYFASPYFDEYNNSIAGFFEFVPYADAHYINDYDTLLFGNGTAYYWPIWLISHAAIKCVSDNMGLFGNYFYENYITDTYKIRDNTGNVIYEGTGLELETGSIDPGLYSVEQTNTFCPFNWYVGTSTLISSFNTTLDDRNPPPISQIQLINADNTMKYHFEKPGEEVSLKFSASDFIYYDDNHIGINFQSVADSKTEVAIKQHNATEWISADYEIIYSDSIIGSQFMANLTDYLLSDSAMYDIKIYVEDQSGNSSENTLSPAFIYGNFSVGIPDNQNNDSFGEIITFTPNPTNNFVTVSNTEAYNSTSLNYEIINTSGSIVKKGLIQQNTSNPIIDICDLAEGLYIISLRSNNKLIISSKIIKY